jgi:ATP-dependent Clp protease protease subunit
MAASMSTVLLAAGTPGKRYALPNSRVMIHQPSGGAGGQTSDISIAAKEILRWRQTINNILSQHSGQTIEQLEKILTEITTCQQKKPRITVLSMR